MVNPARAMFRRVGDACSGINWRPTRFAEELLHPHVCCLCHVIPNTTVLLPCSHALCESCLAGSVRTKGRGACPLEGESFAQDECQNVRLPVRKAHNLKAHCWNYTHGCPYVGRLPNVLRHYEQYCSYHHVSCLGCGESVHQRDLPRHYKAGCRAPPPAKATKPAEHGDAAEPVAKDPLGGQLAALQSQMSELMLTAQCLGVQLQDVSCALRETELKVRDDLATSLEEISIPGKGDECDEQKVSSPAPTEAEEETASEAGTPAEPGGRGMTLKGNTSRDTRTLGETAGGIGTLPETDAPGDIGKSCDTKTAGGTETRGGTGALSKTPQKVGALEAAVASAAFMPWHLEKKHILRKLEVLASDTLRYLEDLRSGIPRPASSVARCELIPLGFNATIDDKVWPIPNKWPMAPQAYRFSFRGTDQLFKPGQFDLNLIAAGTRWHRRDVYFTVVLGTLASTDTLEVLIKWDDTVGGGVSPPEVSPVTLLHPCASQNRPLGKECMSPLQCAALPGGWMRFSAPLPELKSGSDFFQDGVLNLEVAVWN